MFSRIYLTLLLSLFFFGFVGKSNPTFDRFAGEKLFYVAQYGESVIATGGVHCQSEQYNLHGKKCYKVNASGKSIGLVDVVTKVDDRFTSYIDPQTKKSRKFVMNLNEGAMSEKAVITFEFGKAIEKNINTNEVKTHVVPHNVHDIISAFYHVRDLPFETFQKGTIHNVPVFLAGKIVQTKFKYLGKSKINTRLGMKNAFMIQPIIPFRSKILSNTLRAWISDDDDRVPLKVFAKTQKTFLSIDLKSFKK